MKRRDLRLEKYEISTFTYRELMYFCLQYEEKKTKAHNARQLDAVNNEGMPPGSGVSVPTESKAILAAHFLKDCEMVEQSAIEATDGACYQQLIKNVTLGVPYYCLDVPCGKNQFSEMRRRFYYLLAKRKGLV